MRQVTGVKAFNIVRTFNTATDPSEILLPAAVGVVYFIKRFAQSTQNAITGGPPSFEMLEPFTANPGFTATYPTVPGRFFMDGPYLASLAQHNDNAASVGTVSLAINGFTITFQ
ncbi:MAG: hypothetical protein M0R40_09765 [Firmicutes bacterium]|nr:hypothetical protein [Bacillota bacterium]